MAIELKMEDVVPLTHMLWAEVARDRMNRVLTLHEGSYVRQLGIRYYTKVWYARM